MKTNTPLPLCKAFLVLSQIKESANGEVALIGLPRRIQDVSYPAETPISFFARLTSAHGEYLAEIQLQTPEGKTVWREGPPEPWGLHDPLEMYDLKFNVTVKFRKPGLYNFVLLMNGEEVARQPFPAILANEPTDLDPTQGDQDEEE